MHAHEVTDLILYAIPAFLVLLAVEFLALRHIHAHGEEEEPHPGEALGYDSKDTRTSLAMGLGNGVIHGVWRLAEIAVMAWLYTEVAPFQFPASQPYTYAALFLADDFAFYWYHRIHHEVRLFWAQHVVHHSSERFNLSTALRQQWLLMTELPFWAPLAILGFQPAMIVGMHAVSLMYQYWIHTEAIKKMPRWFEAVLNTPSHHRVHHGSNEQYLDRNYGGILIIWDRIFGSFEPEGERVKYGLTKNIHTHNPLKVFSHEWVAIWRDVRAADTWRERFGYMFRGPGWSPDGEGDRRERERDREPAEQV
ncbi:MAG TPA: sterol desaturase family protein [Solirubrobacterales bacterium]|jgi:sterol desaturase/sphingolipid hydroxylase (fatty acid hydroxylase superfamily)|nr:sterol desaturase family protein [Solirubrobacterales bacterium]